MSWVAVAIMGYSAYQANKSAKEANKRASGMSAPFEKYSGYKPPHVSFLRPVEKQITDIVMQRSLGQGVGYDPARREALLKNFDIEQGRNLETQKADIQNRLSGMGLSRNLAANEELMGRALTESGRERNLYTNRVDIEDLARANEERDTNTARLQALNRTNFGQENKVADFDLDVFNAESGNERARRGLIGQQEQLHEDPYAAALQGAGAGYEVMNPPARSPQITFGEGAYSPLSQQQEQSDNPMAVALKKKGQQLVRGGKTVYGRE